MLWLLTALAVLQWSAPTLDPSLLLRLLPGHAGDATLAAGKQDAAAVVEARSAPSIVVVEKRPSGGRLLSAGSDDAGVAGTPVVLRVGTAVLPASEVPPGGPPRGAAERPFTARSPPTRA